MARAGTLTFTGTALGIGRCTTCALVSLTLLAILRCATLAFFRFTTPTLFGVTTRTLFGSAAIPLFRCASIPLFSGLTLALGGRASGPLVGLTPRAFLRGATLALFGFQFRQFLRCLCGATRMLLRLRLFLPGLFLACLLLACLLLRCATGAFFC